MFKFFLSSDFLSVSMLKSPASIIIPGLYLVLTLRYVEVRNLSIVEKEFFQLSGAIYTPDMVILFLLGRVPLITRTLGPSSIVRLVVKSILRLILFSMMIVMPARLYLFAVEYTLCVTDSCSCRSLTSEIFNLVSVNIEMLFPFRICCDMISLFNVIFFSFLSVFLLNTVCSMFSALNRELTLRVAMDRSDVKSLPLSISLFEFLLGMFVILSCLLLIVFFPRSS